MGLVDTLKDVVILVQKTDNIELVKHVLSLQSQVLEMQDENRRQREQVAQLTQMLDFAKQLRFEAPFYVAADDKTPFCARCWEADRRAIHLKGDWKGKKWECFKCGSIYLLDDTAKPSAVWGR